METPGPKAPSPDDPLITEVLSRIALMTGVGFDLNDIASRLRIDTGISLSPDLITILQVELGMVRGYPRLFLQSKLIMSGLSSSDAAWIADLVWNDPCQAGIELTSRGFMGRGSKILQGVPRSQASICKASSELWRIAHGKSRGAHSRIRQLAENVGLDVADLPATFKGQSNAFSGMEVRVNLPRGGKNPFRTEQTA